MNKISKFLSVILVLILGFSLWRTPVATAPKQIPAQTASVQVSTVSSVQEKPNFVEVKRVIDGDTIDVLENGRTIRVRLIGINAPESVDPRKPVECFGSEASRKLKDILPAGTQVRLEADSSQDAQDKYGRTLAYVFLPDGTDINELMVAEGFAREYTYRKPYKFQKKFKDAQASARVASRGLFAPGACI